jgi:Leucine-rich repeat (LRR) protein
MVLSSCRLGEDDARTLAARALPATSHLELLDLSGNALGDGGVDALAAALPDLRSLATLRLGSVRLSPRGACALSAALPMMRALAELRLDGNALGNEGASAVATALAALPHLRYLDLSNCRICDSGAVALAAAFPLHLEALLLRLNAIVNEGFKPLAAHLPTLRGLHLFDVCARVPRTLLYPLGDARTHAASARAPTTSWRSDF